MQEAQTGHIFTSLATITRGTFTDVVIGPRLVHTYAVFTVVLLTRAGLLIQTSNQWLNLTKLARKLWRTLARVFVDAVTTRAPVLTHVVSAVVNVGRTVLSDKPGQTLTRVVREMVLARASILTWINFVGS